MDLKELMGHLCTLFGACSPEEAPEEALEAGQSGIRSAQGRQGETEWSATYMPIAQHIVYGAIHLLPFIFHQAYFGGKPVADWLYLPMVAFAVVVMVAFFPAIAALAFPNKISPERRCRLVRVSLVGLMIGIALALIACVIRRATANSQPAVP